MKVRFFSKYAHRTHGHGSVSQSVVGAADLGQSLPPQAALAI